MVTETLITRRETTGTSPAGRRRSEPDSALDPVVFGWGAAQLPFAYSQDDLAAWMSRGKDVRTTRRIRAAFTGASIDRRSSCLPDFACLPQDAVLFRGANPTTAERMRVFSKVSVEPACDAARRALTSGGVLPAEVTHLLLATCTGFAAPGLDQDLMLELGLAPSVRRVLLGFQGCSAGVVALRTASEIARGDSRAIILVVSVELCSLHFQPDLCPSDLRGHALFADGAGAAVVGTRSIREGTHGKSPPEEAVPWIQLHEGRSLLLNDTRELMSWDIEDFGFRMRISRDVPASIERALPAFLEMDRGVPEWWVVHPGGPAILDRIQLGLGLSPDRLEDSRSVLRKHGNMSSATVFYIFDRLTKRADRAGSGSGEVSGIALAFGPGLCAEALQFSWKP